MHLFNVFQYHIRQIILTGFQCLILGYFSYSQTTQSIEDLTFNRFSISEGLSHIGVPSFCQDSKGFMWIGTYDGLNRFDGLSFDIYKNNPKDSISLVNNRVLCLKSMSDDKIWIGTQEGVYIFDPHIEQFSLQEETSIIWKKQKIQFVFIVTTKKLVCQI